MTVTRAAVPQLNRAADEAGALTHSVVAGLLWFMALILVAASRLDPLGVGFGAVLAVTAAVWTYLAVGAWRKARGAGPELWVRDAAQGVELVAPRAFRPAGKAVGFDPAVPVVLDNIKVKGNFSTSTRWYLKGSGSLTFTTQGAATDEHVAAVFAGVRSTGLTVTPSTRVGSPHG